MSKYLTKLAATVAAYHMRYADYRVRTILNVGVGRGLELGIWKTYFPRAKVLGIDPRPAPHWWSKGEANVKYIQTAVDSQKLPVIFCEKCGSIRCGCTWGKGSVVDVKTLDDIVAEHAAKPPFFIWMDIEGAEIDALESATEVLRDTGWISIEVRPFPWDTEYHLKVHRWLTQRGYHHVYSIGDDRLYSSKELKIV